MQIFLLLILPKDEQKSSILVYQATKIEDFCSLWSKYRLHSYKLCMKTKYEVLILTYF